MRRRWPDRAAAAALALLGVCAAPAAGQAPTAFTAPDGTRFVLAPDPAATVVHWAVASPIDQTQDPPGHEGLAWTLTRLSLHGTWRSGSHDVEREQAAQLWLDEAWQRLLRDPRDAVAGDDVRRWDEQARELGDRRAWLRALAAAPSWQPGLAALDGAAVLSLTTTRAALPEVARLLVERREDQALRELHRGWLETFQERGRAHVADPLRTVRAELLALTMPDHPASRTIEAPNPAAPSRELAQQVWALTQRPTATVHVLQGDLDVDAAKAALAAAFARTDLVAKEQPPLPRVRPLAGARRSTIKGGNLPAVALAWTLPAQVDGEALAATLQWLGGEDGEVARSLRAAGHKTGRAKATAPWPPVPDGRSLLVIECSDDAGVDRLADDLLAACKAAAAAGPTDEALARSHREHTRAWQQAHPDARAATAAAAAAHLAWPTQPFRFGPPPAPTRAAVQACAQQVFAGAPAIVELRP